MWVQVSMGVGAGEQWVWVQVSMGVGAGEHMYVC